MPRPHARLRLAPFVALTALVLAGCDWTVLDPDRPFTDRRIEGRYEGSFVLEWETFDRTGRRGRDRDPGSIRIDRAHRSSFDGSWRWRLDGRWLSGELDRGRWGFGDDVSFSLRTRLRRDLLEEVTGCRFVSGDWRFHGFLGHGRLRAERTARLRCRGGFGGRGRDLWVRVSFSGRRGGFLF